MFLQFLLVLLIVPLISSVPFDSVHDNAVEQAPQNRGLISCYPWYLTQGDPNKYLAQTLNPPCNIPKTFPSTLLGGWSVDPGCNASKQPDTCDLHKGAYGCYRSALASTGPGAQACYDQAGRWISDPWKGAGTLDVETPIGDLAQQAKHGVVDVAPYYDCCVTLLSPQPYTCNLYYKKRPPGHCENKPAV